MIIDIHGHLSPPEAARRFPMPPSLTDVDGMLAARAQAGIDLTIIGSPVGAGAMARVPGVDNYAQPRDRLRGFHAWMSGLISTFPDQLRGYVYANPFGDDDHLEGVRETLADPAFVGLITTSSVHGELLGSPRADSFFALAAETGVPVLVHAPAEPIGTDRVDDFGFVEQIGRFGDVTMGMAMIAFAGWLDKYPGLRLIGATGGGALALLPERLQTAARPRHWGGGPPSAPSSAPSPSSVPAAADPAGALQRMYVDTSTFSPAHLGLNAEVLGPERMLFGTDSPPMSVPLEEFMRMIEKLPIDKASQQLILGGNAETLFDLRSRP
ncbi:amidohydrolase [Streptomyces sp. NBC_01221]|uniref:amidohydrolase family protein n=1 Tax=unclassified Streptomyces TaxID=2593676 RepID=UPI00225A5931|nr:MULTISPECIES: amidohydrolase family protein [unclassified Streptomyces]MCX4791319.1 amidohydrolase [Streptomyces sp. NBC_01221]MCX4792971.1 amidohydrolase [Streptomyces sp. NBC_01242]WSP59534.1 amidohydrolase [Streptomyces sp. NBC_01241]WSU19950.1 amidohydrolase [Streptomyces sp. NBC_01108]